MVCRRCKSAELRRAHRHCVSEFVFSFVGLYPYVCSTCKQRVLRPKFEQILLIVCTATVILGATAVAVQKYTIKRRPGIVPPSATLPVQQVRLPGAEAALAGQNVQPDPVYEIVDALRNKDIIELSKSGMGSDVIAKLIRKAPHRFDVDSRSLVELKHAGVKDDVIGLLIDVSFVAPPGTLTPSVPILASVRGIDSKLDIPEKPPVEAKPHQAVSPAMPVRAPASLTKPVIRPHDERLTN